MCSSPKSSGVADKRAQRKTKNSDKGNNSITSLFQLFTNEGGLTER